MKQLLEAQNEVEQLEKKGIAMEEDKDSEVSENEEEEEAPDKAATNRRNATTGTMGGGVNLDFVRRPRGHRAQSQKLTAIREQAWEAAGTGMGAGVGGDGGRQRLLSDEGKMLLQCAVARSLPSSTGAADVSDEDGGGGNTLEVPQLTQKQREAK